MPNFCINCYWHCWGSSLHFSPELREILLTDLLILNPTIPFHPSKCCQNTLNGIYIWLGNPFLKISINLQHHEGEIWIPPCRFLQMQLPSRTASLISSLVENGSPPNVPTPLSLSYPQTSHSPCKCFIFCLSIFKKH